MRTPLHHAEYLQLYERVFRTSEFDSMTKMSLQISLICLVPVKNIVLVPRGGFKGLPPADSDSAVDSAAAAHATRGA